MSIELPWPPKELSPNARVHWTKRAKAAKEYRHLAYLACKSAKLIVPATLGKLHLWIDFHPPRLGRHDLDNCLSRLKNGIDGIADYLGVDDCMYAYHIEMKEKIAGGMVKIRITSGTELHKRK